MRLREGQVIPAHPLALNARRELDERRQRAITRYYMASGAGGIAVGVHTTQFAIRSFGMYAPVLELAAETVASWRSGAGAGPSSETSSGSVTRGPGIVSATCGPGIVMVAGLVGDTAHAVAEAQIASSLGYDAGLLSLGGGEWTSASDEAVIDHCRAVGEVIPLFGFYLQPAVGGRILSHAFWRELAELPALVAVKVAPFNRYQTLDVVRAIVESGREDVALYTGNDDSIMLDLITPYQFMSGGRVVERYMAGGLLGQWAVWTSRAVAMLDEIRAARGSTAESVPVDWLSRGAHLTDANGAIFDVANGYAGCIAGIHEVLRRQGLMMGTWCLDPREGLSAGQSEEIDRVLRNYPELQDDDFVARNLDEWMS
jgi:dihydrodipicolinate synthase/N-acetylneuraminate lyase